MDDSAKLSAGSSNYVVSKDKEIGKSWKGMDVEVSCRELILGNNLHWPGGDEENHETSQSGWYSPGRMFYDSCYQLGPKYVFRKGVWFTKIAVLGCFRY